MSIWTANTITRFSQEAESTFADEYPCIITRLSLTITANTSTYALPDNVRSIRRISWQGWKLDPLGQRNMREVFQYASQVGKPFWYVFNNIGANNIQFFPIPNASINPSGLNLYSSDPTLGAIPVDVIVEYYMLPDFVTNFVPVYFRQRLLKPYVVKKCMSVENQGQNVKYAKYWSQRWDLLKQKYGDHLNDIHNKSRKLCLNGITSNQFFPGQPILPVSQYGIGIDDGWS
jgi:hypothetical protein